MGPLGQPWELVWYWGNTSNAQSGSGCAGGSQDFWDNLGLVWHQWNFSGIAGQACEGQQVQRRATYI